MKIFIEKQNAKVSVHDEYDHIIERNDQFENEFQQLVL
jgi:hypothetical protein